MEEVEFLRTGKVARELDVPVHVLKYWIQRGWITPPKDSAGQYVWTPEQMEQAALIRDRWLRERGENVQ